ncbi:MAG: hypothetical protein K0S33_248 [Bacteroidetes bacterium]|jgi:hypothetical protein|nr:hypothetical protein [Bacteroidota bacterium]
MKKLFIAFAAVSLIISAASCKKKKAFKNEDGQVTEDNRNVQQQSDDAMGYGDNAIGNYQSLTGKLIGAPASAASVLALPCGTTVDTTHISQGSITLNFDGVTVCDNRKRSGSIKLTILGFAQGKQWKDTACVLQMDYTNYRVTRSSDNKSLMFNGTQYLTNVVGGNFITWLFGGTVIRTITGNNLQVTFDNGSVASWNINRKYTYSNSNGAYTCLGEGLGSYNGETALENWGTTRDGDAFTSKVETPILWNSTCMSRPVQGKMNIKVADKDFDLKVTLGVDNSGNVVGVQANSCPYGWKVEWTYKNKSNDKVFGYW